MGKILIIALLIDAAFIFGIIWLLKLKKNKKINEGLASVLALLGLFVVMLCSLVAMMLAALMAMAV